LYPEETLSEEYVTKGAVQNIGEQHNTQFEDSTHATFAVYFLTRILHHTR
jgi:hypothetical protein